MHNLLSIKSSGVDDRAHFLDYCMHVLIFMKQRAIYKEIKKIILKSRLNFEGFFLYMFITVRCTMYGNKVSVDLSYKNLKVPIRIHECKAIFKHCKRRTLAETAPLQER